MEKGCGQQVLQVGFFWVTPLSPTWEAHCIELWFVEVVLKLLNYLNEKETTLIYLQTTILKNTSVILSYNYSIFKRLAK